MGKLRHSAKTGDKKLYARRQLKLKASLAPVEDLQAERDESYLALGADDVSEGSLDEQPITKQHVFDLGVSDDSSEGEYSSDDDGGIEDVDGNPPSSESGCDHDDSGSDNDISGKSNAPNDIDPRSWGKKKSAYYDADTGDLEIGQDEQVRCAMHKCVPGYHVSLTLLERMPSWKKQQLGKCRHLVLVKWIKVILFFPKNPETGSKIQRSCLTTRNFKSEMVSCHFYGSRVENI